MAVPGLFLALINHLGKSIKFELASAEGACIAQKFRLVRMNNFHTSWVTQFCQLPPILPAPAKNVPILRGTVMPQIFGKGSSDLPIGFWGWALEGTFSRPKRRAPPIFRPPVDYLNAIR